MPAVVAKAAQYAQVEALLTERNSQRSIVRATGVARMTIAKLIKKAALAPSAAASPDEKGPAPKNGSPRTR